MMNPSTLKKIIVLQAVAVILLVFCASLFVLELRQTGRFIREFKQWHAEVDAWSVEQDKKVEDLRRALKANQP